MTVLPRRPRSHVLPWLGMLACTAGALGIVACEGSPTAASPAAQTDADLALERGAEVFDASRSGFFTPLPTSAACTVGGNGEQVQVPTGFVTTLVAHEPNYPGNPDMNTMNETGPRAGRYLYRAHELSSNAAVSVTDLVTGETRILAQRADWERFDGIVWTPWNTILAAEETDPAESADPDVPEAKKGLVYEIDPTTGSAMARPAIGSRAHEGLRFDAEGNLYGISETNPGYIFKFVPDHRHDLSSGQLYALQIVQDLGDRTGWGVWVPLDRHDVRIDSDAEAAAAGATGFNRPEDVETSQSTGDDRRGNRMLYVAVTAEHRVLAIDLHPFGGRAHDGQVLVSDYVRQGVNAPSDFSWPDNLALDRQGNLFITEDPGGNFAGGKRQGDDIWMAAFDPSNSAHAASTSRFATITDCEAEPTGIYMSRSGKSLFVNIQHRGGDGADLTYAIQKITPDLRVASQHTAN